jgi:hypothetical protein
MKTSFKICHFSGKPGHICAGLIFRGGVEVRPAVGFGFSHTKIIAHKVCLRRQLEKEGWRREIIGNIFRALPSISGELKVEQNGILSQI